MAQSPVEPVVPAKNDCLEWVRSLGFKLQTLTTYDKIFEQKLRKRHKPVKVSVQEPLMRELTVATASDGETAM